MSNKIVTHTANGNSYLIVEVPVEAYDFSIVRNDKYFHLLFSLSDSETEGFAFMYKDFGGKSKYPKDLSIMFIAETAIEDEKEVKCSDVVSSQCVDAGYGEIAIGFWNYLNPPKDITRIKEGQVFENDPCKSLNSLIRSNFPDPNKHHLIIKKL